MNPSTRLFVTTLALSLLWSAFPSPLHAVERGTVPRARVRPFPTHTSFLLNGHPNVLIIYGADHRDLALRLRKQLRELTGAEFPLMHDTEATAGRLWTLTDDVRNRNLILLGDINTNRGVLALYAKFLAAATGAFPGVGRYVLRHLAEPFVRGRTAMVIGASDSLGLELGITRFLDLLRTQEAPRRSDAPPFSLDFPLLEFGDADGPKRIPESGDTFRDYRDAAYVFYSGGRPPARYAWFGTRSPAAARRAARELVLAETERDTSHFPVGGHYTFIPNYQALRIIISHGLLSAAELCKLEEKLIDNALASRDSYITYFQGRRKRILTSNSGNPSRHSSAAIVGQYLLLDYLANFAELSDTIRESIQADYSVFTKLIRDWNEARMFRAGVGDLESLDCTAFMIYGFMHLGLDQFVTNGVLENMTNFYLNNVNNLWCDAGASHYIGAYRGCHTRSPDGGLAVRALAYFTRDRGLEFLDTQRFEKAGTYQRGFCDKARMCLGQPEPFALTPVGNSPAVLPCPVLRTTPLDPFMWQTIVADAKKNGAALPLTYDQAYDTIGFRDGWSADDAFLAIKGLHGGRLWQVNSIVGHTDYGARFLFGGSQTHENWYRSSITVDTAEYGKQDAFARLNACVSTKDVALVASTCASFNGMRWQRTVVRHRGVYFAVLDDLTALRDDDFRVTATWRILPPGRIDDTGVFRAIAQNGAEFAIAPGAQVTAEVTRPAVDGVSRPTFYRQQRSVQLSAGETLSFHNVITAAPASRPEALAAQTVGNGKMLRMRRDKQEGSQALIGTGQLPGSPALPAGECAAFILSEHLWIMAGVRDLHLDTETAFQSSEPVDVIVDWANARTEVHIRGSQPVRVSPGALLGGTATDMVLPPGIHTFSPGRKGTADLRPALNALPMAEAHPASPTTVPSPPGGFMELWHKQVQAQPARLIRPFRIEAEQAPDTMAIHNLHDGVLWTSSIPAPVWRGPELVLVLDPPENAGPITGLRVIGNVGRIVVEEELPGGLGYHSVTTEETQETLFAGYSDNRVGGRLYTGRRLRFRETEGKLRLRLAAPDPDAPSVHVGEIQLLGTPQADGVWGRLLVDRFAPTAAPLLLCRTGTYVDTVERGAALTAFSMDGTQLWSHAETAPAQYRGKYWCTGDTNGDAVKELITYADDMVVRVFAADGRIAQTVDLHEWEKQRQGASIGNLTCGGKSMALWPPCTDGPASLFVFGHVHHHQIRLATTPEIVRRDRLPTIDCAPAASLAVSGWSGPNSEDLVGVAPYAVGVVLWREDGPGEPPKLVVQQPFTPPLVQPSANNQQPVLVECLRVLRPEGIIAATPRGVQFFAKPDLKPGWLFAGMCPTSAVTVVPQAGEKTDLVVLGRENGRIVMLECGTGKLRRQTALSGAVRRILVTASGTILAGTSHGLFLLNTALEVLGRHPCRIEDIAFHETVDGTSVFVLSSDGRLTALRMAITAR